MKHRPVNKPPRPKPEDEIYYTMLSEEDLLDFALKNQSEKVDTTIDEVYQCQMASIGGAI